MIIKIQWHIYIINFLLALSSVIGMTLIPLFIVSKLGFSLFVLGLIEGSSEFFSQILRFYSGTLFDKKKDKLQLFMFPIFLALISKIVLINPTAITVTLTKFIERISNGYFGTLRDSLILRLSELEGKNLGFLNISKSLGCLLAPIVIIILNYLYCDSYIFYSVYFCILVCLFALLLGYLLTKFTIKLDTIKTENLKITTSDFKNMKPIYPILALGFLFFLARWNDGMIIIFLKEFKDCPDWVYLSTIGIFNGFMLVLSPFIGKLLDTGKSKACLFITILSMFFFNLLCYNLQEYNLFIIFLALFFWGCQRLTSQMVFIYLIKKNVNKQYLGQAIGLYSVLVGIAVLIAASTAGFLAKFNFSFIFMYSLIVLIVFVIILYLILNSTNITFK